MIIKQARQEARTINRLLSEYKSFGSKTRRVANFDTTDYYIMDGFLGDFHIEVDQVQMRFTVYEFDALYCKDGRIVESISF